MTWTMPCRGSWMSYSVMPNSRQLLRKRVDLLLRDRVDDRQAAVGRRHVVVDGRERPLRPANLAAGQPQALERLGAGDFVHQVQVDVQDRLPAGLVVDDVLVPDFFEQRAGFGGHGDFREGNL